MSGPLIEATDSSVDAIRLVTPGVKVVEIDATGLSIRLPYDSPGADPGAGYERVLAAEIAGDFSAIMGTRYPWSEALTDAEMSAMTSARSRLRIWLLIPVPTPRRWSSSWRSTWPLTWTLSIDEARLIAEGQIGNTLQDLDELSGLDETADGSLQDRVDALRLTTQPLIDSGADDLIRVEGGDGPQYVGGIRVNPGDSVVDYSALSSGIDGMGIGYEHVIGTGYNDTLISDWSAGHVISGGAGDDQLGSRGGGFGSNDTFVGGSGADTFHLAIEPYMTTPYVLSDFNPGDGDRIELLFNSGAADPVFGFSDGQLLASFVGGGNSMTMWWSRRLTVTCLRARCSCCGQCR